MMPDQKNTTGIFIANEIRVRSPAEHLVNGIRH